MAANSDPRQLSFTASPGAWRIVADQWYGGMTGTYDAETLKEAEKLMADADDAAARMERSPVDAQQRSLT